MNAGEKTFEDIGCGSCHVATLQSGDSQIAALRHRQFHPYSDFLLHDMASLGDGISQGAANGREIRTAPLWGLRMVTKYLHDGRATTIEQATTARGAITSRLRPGRPAAHAAVLDCVAFAGPVSNPSANIPTSVTAVSSHIQSTPAPIR